MNNTAIHISDVRTFRSCRRRWDWSSPLRGNLEPAVPYIPFFTGKAFHAALEYYYRDAIPFAETVDKYLASEEANMAEIVELWPDEVDAFNEQVDLIRDIIYHYSLWQAQDTRKYSDRNLEFISLEQAFDIPLPLPDGTDHPTLRMAGRFDGIVKHRETGQYWIWETKTTRSIAELTRSLSNDEQCGVYMYAASKMMDVPIAGVLYNIVRKKAPVYAKVLTSGKLSKAASIDTTAFHYLTAVKETHPDWTDEEIVDEYGDFMASLIENESKYFQRFPVYRSATELKMLMQNIYHTASEMVDPNLKIYPAPSWLNCNFCSFRSPCLAMNAGSNYEVLLEAEFVNRTHNVSMRPDGETDEVS